MVELKCFLNTFKTSQQIPNSFQIRILVIIGPEFLLEGTHGIDCVDITGQGSEKGVVNNTLPGFVGQCCGIATVQKRKRGSGSGSRLSARRGSFVFRLEHISAPIRKTFHSGCCCKNAVQHPKRFRVKALELDIIFENDDIFRPGFQSFLHTQHMGFINPQFPYCRDAVQPARTRPGFPVRPFQIRFAPNCDDPHVPARRHSKNDQKKSQTFAS